jgi:hypothetical protein
MPDEASLRAKAGEAIRIGKLPSRLPDRTWVGPGIGTPCAICSEAVKRDHMEVDIQFKYGGPIPGLERFHAHVRCFAAWELERDGRGDNSYFNCVWVGCAAEHPRGPAVRATLRLPARWPLGLAFPRRRDPGEFGVCSRSRLPARPLWTRNLSVFTSDASSRTGACRTTASKRFGVVEATTKHAKAATRSSRRTRC